MNKIRTVCLCLIFVGLLLMIIFISVQPAKARTITVDDSGGQQYTTIQAAVNAASAGDTVYVYNGTYNEQVLISKSINLIGESNQSTIIKGSGALGSTGVYITANYVNVSNVKIDNFDYGIYLRGVDNNTISSNTITNNKASNIYLRGSRNNTIDSNTIAGGNCGVCLCADEYVSGADLPLIFYDSTNNIVSFNRVMNCCWGIYIVHCSDNALCYNTIIDSSGGGIYLEYYSSNNTIASNVAINSGIFIRGGDNIVSNNTINDKPLLYFKNINSIASPQVLDNMTVGGIILYNCTGFVIKNTTIEYGDIILESSSYVEIISNTIINTMWDGIYIKGSNNEITYNAITNSTCGISIVGSNNNITFNTITNSSGGIYLGDGSYDNIISHNIITNCDFGISTSRQSWGNMVFDNNITTRPKKVNNNISGFLPGFDMATPLCALCLLAVLCRKRKLK